jgi:hypothetical protein
MLVAFSSAPHEIMATGSQPSLSKMSHSDEYEPGQRGKFTQDVQHLIVALDEAKELVRDLSARNEILASQLEEVAGQVEARIGFLEQKITAANDHAERAHRQVQEIVNSRIWRFLVRLAGIGLRPSSKITP